MAEQEQDRSEKATPFKLQEAKRRGQVAKSLDFNSFFLLAGATALLSLGGQRFLTQGLLLERSILAHGPTVRDDPTAMMNWLGSIGLNAAVIVAPIFLTVMIIAVLSNMIQTGPIFTFFPLKPDPKRINPVEGFKRVFSKRMLFEAVKTFFKLGLFSGIAYLVIVSMLPLVISMQHMDPLGYPSTLIGVVSSLTFKLLIAVLFVALLDFIYTRWDFGQKMRMSRRELKEEVKRREGDPQVRSKIKELQREAVKRSRSVKRVPDADVLITNPTHFAVALRYQRERMGAPQLIAKGAGETAEAMRAVARQNRVPIVERPILARQLFREVDIDAVIPEAVYESVARIYAEIYVASSASVHVGVER